MLQYDKILDLRRLSCNNVHVMARYLFVPSNPPGAIYSMAAARIFRISIHCIRIWIQHFPKVLEPDPEVPNGPLKKKFIPLFLFLYISNFF
jgi:hypothetical protein